MRTVIVLLCLVGLVLYLGLAYFLYGTSFGAILRHVPNFGLYVLLAVLFSLLGVCTILPWPKIGIAFLLVSIVSWLILDASIAFRPRPDTASDVSVLHLGLFFCVIAVPAMFTGLAAYLAYRRSKAR